MIRSFLPKLRSIHGIHISLVLLWLATFILHEKIIPHYLARSCSWPQVENSSGDQIGNKHILLIADPQLIDNHTYPGRNELLLKLSKHTVDMYIRKNYNALTTALSPDYMFFLGDYLDNGRSSSEAYYQKELKRFESIFNKQGYTQNENWFTNVAGNHDIGWADGVKLASRQRFNRDFGPMNKIVNIDGVEFIMMDTISFSATEPEINEESIGFFEKNFNSKEAPRVLLAHVPFYRDTSVNKCGPLRENPIFHLDGGYQYNLALASDVSNKLLRKIKPDLIFTGDDHDYCDIRHTELPIKPVSREITVKSISMAMGIWRPAVQLLTIAPASNSQGAALLYKTDICYLPRPYINIIHYVVMAVVSGIVLLVWSLKLRSHRYNYTVLPLRNYNSPATAHSDSALNSRKLSNFIKEQDLNSRSWAFGLSSYTRMASSSPKFSRIQSSMASATSLAKRWNLATFLKHASGLGAVVTMLYSVTCWTV